MKTKFLTCLVLLATAACSGAQVTGGDGDPGDQTVAELKKVAAEAHASGSAQGDVCGNSGWYGDGECDSFCQDYDSVDCVTDPGGVVCAAFIEEANGYCSRVANDPCIAQDPDCDGQIEPSPPDGAVECTLLSQLPDGVCRPDPNDPCVYYQDPDCSSSGGGGSSPGHPGSGGSSPSNPGNGSSGNPNTTEPSLPVACAEYLEVSDGVCKRDPADPCIFQDPDCSAK